MTNTVHTSTVELNYSYGTKLSLFLRGNLRSALGCIFQQSYGPGNRPLHATHLALQPSLRDTSNLIVFGQSSRFRFPVSMVFSDQVRLHPGTIKLRSKIVVLAFESADYCSERVVLRIPIRGPTL